MDPMDIPTLEKQFELHSRISPTHQNWKLSDDTILRLLQSALYYARRCEILEGQLTKTRADLREIVSDATTSRAQAALAEDPYPQDPNEV